MALGRLTPKLKDRAQRVATSRTSRVLVLVALAAVICFTLPLGVSLVVVYVEVLGHFFGPSGHPDGFDVLMFLLAPAMVPVALGCLAVDAASVAFGWFVIESWRRRRAGWLLPSDRFCRRVTVAG